MQKIFKFEMLILSPPLDQGETSKTFINTVMDTGENDIRLRSRSRSFGDEIGQEPTTSPRKRATIAMS